ncbi:uncharacterized protein BDV17DRAFT_156771 [Aspergillus undulatus]|uniref:uncharacterized protein n=1 Tax=Aspergillus undulatus TaxID=1810928 RepID=UPI003CCE1469
MRSMESEAAKPPRVLDSKLHRSCAVIPSTSLSFEGQIYSLFLFSISNHSIVVVCTFWLAASPRFVLCVSASAPPTQTTGAHLIDPDFLYPAASASCRQPKHDRRMLNREPH